MLVGPLFPVTVRESGVVVIVPIRLDIHLSYTPRGTTLRSANLNEKTVAG
jgi:hypothetical protein